MVSSSGRQTPCSIYILHHGGDSRRIVQRHEYIFGCPLIHRQGRADAHRQDYDRRRVRVFDRLPRYNANKLLVPREFVVLIYHRVGGQSTDLQFEFTDAQLYFRISEIAT